MKKFQFLILFCLVGASLAAQNSFLLYSFKGNVSVVENNAETKAKVGSMLNNNSILKVAAASAVTLICNETAMFSFVKAGSYPLKQFGDSCKVRSNSVSANYIKYVWASMTKTTGSAGSERKAYMNTVGAVRRSVNNIWIDPRLDTINYNSGDFPLSWKSYTESKNYEFSLYTSDNISEPIYKKVVPKLKIPITDFSGKMVAGKTYYWTASIAGEENDELKILNFVSTAAYEKLLAKIKSQGGSFEAPAEQAYRLGFMLEDARYLSEAYQYYTKAASLDSANVLYRSTLMSFKKDYEIK